MELRHDCLWRDSAVGTYDVWPELVDVEAGRVGGGHTRAYAPLVPPSPRLATMDRQLLLLFT